MKKVMILILGLMFLSAASSAWAVSQAFTSKAAVTAPTAISMAINYWPDRTATPGNIDFNLGQTGTASLGKTSWLDSDDWKSKDGNVGFSILCTAPAGAHSFRVSCGTMLLGGGSYSIPYGSPDGLTDYFGFSLQKDGTYIFGSPSTMRKHSETPAVDTWGGADYGHEYSIYNSLKIPVTAPIGSYATTGVSPNSHLTIELI